MTRAAITWVIIGMLLIFLALTAPWARSQEAGPVDVALVLAVDSSASISAEERALQRHGYAEALSSPEVLQAIRMGRGGRIAVTMFEWGSESEKRVVVPWTVIDGPTAAAVVSAQILAAEDGTMSSIAIGAALVYAEGLLASAPPALRRVVDVSGDGPDNGTASLDAIRDRLLTSGVTINGLAILGDANAPVPIDDYYERFVAGGEGSFVVAVNGFSDFARAVRIKLIAEVAGRMPSTRTRFAARS